MQWLAHHHMYALSDTGQYGKFQIAHSNKLANIFTFGRRFSQNYSAPWIYNSSADICILGYFLFSLFYRLKLLKT